MHVSIQYFVVVTFKVSAFLLGKRIDHGSGITRETTNSFRIISSLAMNSPRYGSIVVEISDLTMFGVIVKEGSYSD